MTGNSKHISPSVTANDFREGGSLEKSLNLNHLTIEQIISCVDARLSTERGGRAAYDKHLSLCSVCLQEVKDLYQFKRSLITVGHPNYIGDLNKKYLLSNKPGPSFRSIKKRSSTTTFVVVFILAILFASCLTAWIASLKSGGTFHGLSTEHMRMSVERGESKANSIELAVLKRE